MRLENGVNATSAVHDEPAFTPSVFWMSGLSGAGKSSLAAGVRMRLVQLKLPCYVLDGDVLRSGLCNDLGFSAEDRHENLRRAAYVARYMRDAGLVCLCAFITPLEQDRALVRNVVGSPFFQIFVDCPIEECIRRDPKGLYKRALASQVANFTGISQMFEAPESPDLRVDTFGLSMDEAADMLAAYVARKCMG